MVEAAVLVAVLLDFVALAAVAFVALLLADLDLVLLELDELFFLAAVDAAVTTFAALGVGVVVQYHLPFASAQAWSSFAVPYSSLCPNILP